MFCRGAPSPSDPSDAAASEVGGMVVGGCRFGPAGVSWRTSVTGCASRLHAPLVEVTMKEISSSLGSFSTPASWVKQWAALGAVLASAILAIGCPVYSDNSYGRVGGCYYSTDCPFGHRCTSDGYCVAAPSFDGGGVREASVGDAHTTDV